MLYVGIAGIGATLLVSVIMLVVLKKKRKNIISKLNEEYGGNSGV